MKWPKIRILVLVLAAAANTGHAQELGPVFVTAQPTFTNTVVGMNVAAGLDGTIVFTWGERQKLSSKGDKFAVTRPFAVDGTPLGPAVRIDGSGRALAPLVRPDTRGGFVAIWEEIKGTPVGRYLDSRGVGVGSLFDATCGALPATDVTITGLATGAVSVYRLTEGPTAGLRACLFDQHGAQVGQAVTISGSGQDVDVATLADGGFVVTWNQVGGWARLYDLDGQPRGDAVLLTSEFGPEQVAANPLEGFAVAGVRGGGPGISAVMARRFASDGTPLGPNLPVHLLTDGVAPDVDLAFGLGGNLFVTWSVNEVGALWDVFGIGYGPDDSPLGPSFPLSVSGYDVYTVRLPTGSLVATWVLGSLNEANVVSLCTPSVATCGDGTLTTQCEECDTGPGNDDTLPDACRTNCRLAGCGDGVVDTGEECDDGNLVSCDGCSILCASEAGFVCGDGVVAQSCGETCDDTNLVDGDGCSATCALERIPGRGSTKTDCYSEWVVDNPTNDPLLDRRGAVNYKQVCTDDDPGCDFDGGAPGACTFHIRVCSNNTDVVTCEAALRLASWELTKPSAKKALKRPPLAVVRAAFASAIDAIVGPVERDICTDVVAVTVPLRGNPARYKKGKLVLKATAYLPDGSRDKDVLKLACTPVASD